jgi:hypothetical protein
MNTEDLVADGLPLFRNPQTTYKHTLFVLVLPFSRLKKTRIEP